MSLICFRVYKEVNVYKNPTTLVVGVSENIQYKSHLFSILYESAKKGVNQEEFSRILEEYLWSVPM